jgi:two-component system cell cycle sensor histidine kinase/response regulator CckA
MTMPARSELLLHLVIDSIPQRVFWKDRDSVYLGCNRSFARDAGLDEPALIVGKTDFELAWKATAHLYVADDRLVMESNTAKVDIEEPMRFMDGQTIWLRTSKFPLHDESGAVAGVLGTYGDITGRKQAEEALARSELLFRSLIENGLDLIAIVASDGAVRYVSPSVERILGYGPARVRDLNVFDLIHPDDLAEAKEKLRSALETGTRFEQVGLRVRHSDGSWRTLSMMGKPSPPDVGTRGLIVNARDVTESRALEEQLRQSQKMEAVGRLAGGIAHDFNNLLTAILGYAEIAAGRLKPEDPSRLDLSEIVKAAQRAADLTRQLLAFSRKQVLELRVIDLNRVVSNTHKILRRLIGEDVELVMSLKERLSSVKADTGQIEQVLLNLAVNSRDAMPKGGNLTIETSEVELDESYSTFHFDVPPGPYVVLAVSDTGTGMDAKTLSHVFEPFFTTKEAGKGTGLGLSTVYGVVKQSGGHVTAHSEPGVGTTFRIYLPRVEDAPETDHGSPAHAALVGGTETVLVVEDEEAVRRLACRALEAQGYTVLSAAGAREAIRLCEEHAGKIHLMLTDVVMPGVSGRDLARSAAAIRPSLKVLFMSGYTDDAIVHHGVLDAGTPFLQKPFTPCSLAQKVRWVLDTR